MSGPSPGEAGLIWLLWPKLKGKVNRVRTDDARLFKAIGLGFVGLFFWGFIFAIIWRMLLYFRNTQGIGDLLAGKLLGRKVLGQFARIVTPDPILR